MSNLTRTLSVASQPETIVVDPALNAGVFPPVRPGDEWPQFPVAKLRLRQDGHVPPIHETFVYVSEIIERTTAQCMGFDPAGLTNPVGPQPPDTELTPLYWPLTEAASGHHVVIDLRDVPRKFPLHDGQYDVALTIEYQEVCPDIETRPDKAALYAEALRSGWQFWPVPTFVPESTPARSPVVDAANVPGSTAQTPQSS
jgi:hypothetical protein